MRQDIKHWDEKIVERHIGTEVNQIKNYLQNKNKKKISYIDIGANVGKFYDVLSKDFEIELCVMVEASPELFNYLQNKFEKKENCELYNLAISDENGKTFFHESLNNREISDNLNYGLSKISKSGIEIEMMSGYDFINSVFNKKNTNFDFIKIDTENRDFNILKSITPIIENLSDKPLICFEHNYHNDMSKNDAESIYINFLNLCNYKGLPFDELHGDSFLFPLN